ncbi:TIR domain-containing protein [Pedobacter sp. B4-66]|uniref:TIR domain-containing protein n=1 Tax=Pedobacter sp. B4-66 TaxID=2817280 RepID=UPI001BDA4B88|nr:TIR domain-containing protein [Pedobacter sp. B4-66]
MKRKCFISFKTEDREYKRIIQEDLKIDMIDKSLDYAINSHDENHIMRKIREDHLSDSTVTIHLIGSYGAQNRGDYEQRYIKRELQASLYHGDGNTINGILGVVLPGMEEVIYKGTYTCSNCNSSHNTVNINDTTVIKEFSYNYYIPNNKCSHSEDDRYCVLVKWRDFVLNPEQYIEIAFAKRDHSIVEKIKVYPK